MCQKQNTAKMKLPFLNVQSNGGGGKRFFFFFFHSFEGLFFNLDQVIGWT